MVGLMLLGEAILAQDVVGTLAGFAKLPWNTLFDPLWILLFVLAQAFGYFLMVALVGDANLMAW